MSTPEPIEGKAYWFADQLVIVRFPSAQAAIDVGIMEITTPEGSGPPPHVHSREDELFLILEGTYDVMVGDAHFEAGAGAWIFGPRGQSHGYTVRSGIGRHVSLTTPGGFERFFEAAGRPAESWSLPTAIVTPDIASLASIASAFGVTLLPQPARNAPA